jgi:signal peptidase I
VTDHPSTRLLIERPFLKRRGRRRVLGGVVAACAVGLVVLLAYGWIAGWRVHEMTTPSMGTAAPVGSVVISRPASIADVRVGEIVVFHPPGRRDTTFAHRIVAITAGPGGGGIRTKGDINPTPDAWVLHDADLIGRVTVTVPDLGFLVEALPLLLLGTFVILLATGGMRVVWRGAARIAGGCLLVAFLLVYFRPLERAVLIEQHIADGRGTAVVVPTGVLPIRVAAVGGSHTTIDPGQLGVVHISHLVRNGAFRISTSLHLTGWWWATLAVFAVPLAIGLGVDRTHRA